MAVGKLGRRREEDRRYEVVEEQHGYEVVDESPFDRIAFAALTPEIRDAFDLSDTGITAVAAVTSVFALLAALPLGILADRFDRVKISIAAGLLWGTAAVATGLVWAVPLLYLVRFLSGVGRITNEVVHPSLLSDYYPTRAHPQVYGAHRLANASAPVAGPVAGAIAGAVSWEAAFFILAIPTGAALIGALRLREPNRGESVDAELAASQKHCAALEAEIANYKAEASSSADEVTKSLREQLAASVSDLRAVEASNMALQKKVNKLQHLTWAVLAWDAVHVIGAFELFGGFRGPFVVLLPLLVLGAFLILPRRAALLSTAAMVLALLGLAGLQYQGWLYPYGALGINFTLLPQSLPLNVGVIVVALLVGVKLGDYLGGRQRLEPWGLAVSALYDPRFGCFSRETLAHRCADEVERARRYGQPPALALLALEGLDTLVAERGPDAADAALEALWQQISLHTRHDLDTCAYLGDGVFGLLLPTADTRQAQQVADRVSDRMHQFAPEIAGHLVTNVVAVPTQIGEGTMTALRARALRAVESAEAPA